MNGVPETCMMMGKMLVVLMLLVCITGCGCISGVNPAPPGRLSITMRFCDRVPLIRGSKKRGGYHR